MRSVLTLAAITVASLALCRPAPAQQTAVSVGQRVRVQWPEAQQRRRTVGTVLEVRGDSLALTSSGGERRFALARLERIDVRVRRSRARGAARGAGLGTLTGFGIGLVVGALRAAGCPRQPDDYCELAILVGPVVGVAVGLPLGVVIGTGSPGERWQRVR
jgi:hypothetical protein